MYPKAAARVCQQGRYTSSPNVSGSHLSVLPCRSGVEGPPEFKRLKEPSDSGSESEAGSSRDDGEGEQEEASAPTTTSVMEQMLVDWGNKLRMRVVATVRIGHTDQGEVDVGVSVGYLCMQGFRGTCSWGRHVSSQLQDDHQDR